MQSPHDQLTIRRPERSSSAARAVGTEAPESLPRFQSILCRAGDTVDVTDREPDFFSDLNLDRIVTAVTAGKGEYNLRPFFYTPLRDADAIAYRQEVMRDLRSTAALPAIRSFAVQMRAVRERLAQAEALRYRYQKECWFLDAVGLYCETVGNLARDIAGVELASRGLLAFRDYLADLVASDQFSKLLADSADVKAALSTVKYCLVVRGGSVSVRAFAGEPDYGEEVLGTFEKFKAGAVKDYRAKFPEPLEMDHIEAGLLDRVARLFPRVFETLDEYYMKYRDCIDATLRNFDREIQFYVSYLDHMVAIEAAGLGFCYPSVSRAKAIRCRDCYDLALARKLVGEGATVVSNDFALGNEERIIVVSGPNQGGKTTFARMFGQLHYLAALGCPVPASEARLFLFDRLFTHFERQEDIANLRGKLQDDLVRIRAILDKATPSSIVIMNEIFTSTTLHDAVFLSRKILEAIMTRDLLAVCVTFIDELASLGRQTVSMVSTVVPESPAQRTFRIVRRPADGLAYALALAEKHRVTYADLRERLQS